MSDDDYQGCAICGTFEAVAIHEDKEGYLHFVCEKCLSDMIESGSVTK